MYWALQTTPAGFAMVILAVVPLMTLLFASAHGLEQLRAIGVVGSLVAFGGIALIASERIGDQTAWVPGLIAITLAAAAMAESSVLVKLFPRPHPVVNNALGMSLGAAVLLVLTLADRRAAGTAVTAGHVGGAGLPRRAGHDRVVRTLPDRHRSLVGVGDQLRDVAHAAGCRAGRGRPAR